MPIFKFSQSQGLLPSSFTQDAITPEVEKFNKLISVNLSSLPPYLGLTPQEIRAREKIGLQRGL